MKSAYSTQLYLVEIAHAQFHPMFRVAADKLAGIYILLANSEVPTSISTL